MLPANWDILRAATDNDEDAMKEVVSVYLHQGIKNVKELRSAVQREDPEEVAALAHRFLGSSRFLGAEDISVPLAALVTMGRSHHLNSTAHALVDQTEKEFVRLDHYLKTSHE
jgi:HPt (histidine-containing phosphotransfer) domain-containing protein